MANRPTGRQKTYGTAKQTKDAYGTMPTVYKKDARYTPSGKAEPNKRTGFSGVGSTRPKSSPSLAKKAAQNVGVKVITHGKQVKM